LITVLVLVAWSFRSQGVFGTSSLWPNPVAPRDAKSWRDLAM
jgi:hypothetical protein